MSNDHQALDDDVTLTVAEGLDVVVLSDDEVLIQFGLRSRPSELLRDHDVSGLLGRTIGQILRAPITVAELLSRSRDGQEIATRELLGDLVERGVLCDVRSSPVQQYIQYTFSGTQNIRDGNVGVIGAGPLGARISQSLLQHGIAKLTLLDDRPTDPLWHSWAPALLGSNHNGSRADVALASTLGGVAQSSSAALDREGIESLVEGSDLIILALEQPDLRTSHLVNRYAVRESRPWLMATIDGNLGMVGPLFIPVETACYNDYRTLAFAATPNRGMARRHREHLLHERGKGSFFTGIPSYVDIIAGHTSLAAIHFLLRGSCFAVGRVMVIDFDNMQIDVEDVLKLPRCPVCGTQKSAYRPPVGGSS